MRGSSPWLQNILPANLVRTHYHLELEQVVQAGEEFPVAERFTEEPR
jgi:hypothetical protein